MQEGSSHAFHRLVIAVVLQHDGFCDASEAMRCASEFERRTNLKGVRARPGDSLEFEQVENMLTETE